MPAAPIRRPLTVTVWLLVSVVALVLSPALLVAAELASAVSGDRRFALMTRVFLAYFVRELATLVACGALWLLSVGGLRMHSAGIQAFHWRLLRWFVRGVAASVQRTLQISVAEEPASAAAAAKLRGEEPVLVLSRHAGPADTILLIDRLLSHFDRRPSVVLKDAVALEPAVDLISHRLPHAVLDPDDPEGCRERITATAAALGGRGALLLFPEGGNFTPERRRRALASLRRHRRFDSVHAGERMPHVLPPRPAGTVAALHGSPATDVIFLAHTGLGLAAYPLEIWRRLPVGQTLTTRMWLVPRAEIPTGEDEIAGWLTNWWRRIDSWIDGHGEEEVH